MTVRADTNGALAPTNAPAEVQVIDVLADARWRAASPSGPANSLFCDHRWIATIHDVYGFGTDAAVTSHGDGSLRSVLPFSTIEDPRGTRVVSLPFCDFVDPAVTAADWPALRDVLGIQRPGAHPVRLATPATHPATTDPLFDSVIDGVHHRVPLDRDLPTTWSSYGQLARRQIRRAERSGIRYRIATDQATLGGLHQLHVQVRKHRHHLLAQSFELFEAIKERFIDAGQGWMVVGERDGELLGGCLMLRSGDALHYKFSMSSEAGRRDGVSHGAVHAAIALGYELGSPTFDFGRTDLHADGLLQFKRLYRPREIEIATHTANRRPPTSFDRFLDRLTTTMTHPNVPDRLTASAGSHFYRYFA